MKTKAAIGYAAGKPLEIALVDLEGPRAGEVLVEIKATGICHTDEFTRSGADPEGLWPAIFGHEGAGIVVDVGSGVTSVKKGDHVIPLYTPECRQCKSCTSRKTNLCTAIRATQGKGVMPDGTSRFSIGKQMIHHYMGCSTFSNFTVLPEIAVAKIREDAPFDKVCYIGCGVTTGIGAVINTAKVPAGATVAVFGCGGIGLSAVNGAAIAGADRIIAIDTISSKLDVAKMMGATDVINASNVDPVEAIKEMTGGGVEYSFEAVGLKKTAEQSFQCLRAGGTATIIGMVPYGMKIELHGYDFLRERKIQGSSMGSNRFRVDMPRLLNSWKKGGLKLDHLISSHIKLDEINEGYARLKGGEVLRQLIDFGVAK